MSDVQSVAQEPGSPSLSPETKYRPLRIWPAVTTVIVLWVSHLGPIMIPEMGPRGFRIAAISPLFCAVAMGLWWVLFSRSRWSERFWGTVGATVIGAVGMNLVDPSIRSFIPFCLFIAPCVVTAFGVGMLLIHHWHSPVRVPVALLALALTMGYWDLVRFDGLTGDSRPKMSWRWEPKQEQLSAANRPRPPREQPHPNSVP
jgi:outer membrane protein assembly factor BamB